MSGLSPSDYPEYVPGMGGAASTKVMGFGTRYALIIVDACKAYFDPSSPLSLTSYPLAAQAPSSMKRLLDAARSSKIPIVWTQIKYTHSRMKDAGLLAKKNAALDIFMEGDQRGLGHSIDSDLTSDMDKDDIVMYRKYPSAFLGTNLSSALAALGVDTLIICGACTSGSIRATAVDAMQSGIRPMVRWNESNMPGQNADDNAGCGICVRRSVTRSSLCQSI